MYVPVPAIIPNNFSKYAQTVSSEWLDPEEDQKTAKKRRRRKTDDFIDDDDDDFASTQKKKRKEREHFCTTFPIDA